MRNRWRGLSTIKVIRLKEIVVFVQQQNGAGLWCTLTSTFIHYSRAHWGWTLDRIFVRQQEHNEALWWKKADTFDLFFFFLLLLWRLLLCSTGHNELLWAGTQKEWNVKMFLFSMNWLSAIFFDICRCVSIFVLKKIVVNWGLILKIGKIRNWIENNFWGFFGIFKNNFSEFFAIFHFKKLQFF